MTESAYKSHQLHATLRQLLELQHDEELGDARPTLSEDQAWQLDRVFEVARVVENLMAQTPSTLTSLSSLNNINSYLQQAFAELSSFKSNKNPGHVSNANSHAESTLSQMVGFAGGPNRITDDGLQRIVADMRARSHEAILALAAEKKTLSDEVDRLRALVATQEAKLTDLSNTVDTQKKEATAVTAEVRTAYSATEKALRDEFDRALKAMQAEHASFEEQSKVSATASLNALKSNEEDARRIVQVVGNIGVTGNYQKIAGTEAAAANRMRLATIAFFGAGVVIAVVALAAHLFPNLSPVAVATAGPWELTLRLLTALVVAAPAFYTARESARHRTNSDRARQRELELASLGPFIELLPEPTRQEIVKSMTDRYFGTEVEAHEAKSIIDPKDLFSTLNKAIEGLTKLSR